MFINVCYHNIYMQKLNGQKVYGKRGNGCAKSRFRQYFRDTLFKFTGGLNVGRHVYDMSGVVASDSSHGLPSFLLRLIHSFKNASSVGLYLLDKNSNTLTKYITVRNSGGQGVVGYSRTQIPLRNQSTVEMPSEHDPIEPWISYVISEYGFSAGTYTTFKKGKTIVRQFNMNIGDFEVGKQKRSVVSTHETASKELIIVPISSSDSGKKAVHLYFCL